jgi:hypothetical protein
MFHEVGYVSNYFVYDKNSINLEPLDYAISMVEGFRQKQEK